ncbi:MAG TPA: 2,3-bisphosphoglycerate-independent phosphoglycerate mutase [Anaerolineales bacterium]|jgi:2,3-bisphosphoglycerate-independent phosphoglycerate mutase
MANLDMMRRLQEPNSTKIVLLVMDGLGGLPREAGGPTELEAANTPLMDRLAKDGVLGQIVPVGPGITPGSGPAHLALFGYDPIEFDVGRGVIEAAGIGLEVNEGDLAARGNFCTVDAEGKITDRRAGRISTAKSKPLVDKLRGIGLDGAIAEVEVLREYRFSLLLRGPNLSPNIEETDPLTTGQAPLPAVGLDKASEHAAKLVNDWVAEARRRLADQPAANALTLRGFSTDPNLPKFKPIYGLDPACVAVYPMYRGVSRLVGMKVINFDGETPADEFAAVGEHWQRHDYFFIHIKKTDSLGEDGNFDGKAAFIEQVDQAISGLLDLNPDVLAITGDHSTPSRMRYHSWHPVPLLLWAPETVRSDSATAFGESQCASGGLGTFASAELMPIMMAHARRLQKYGA